MQKNAKATYTLALLKTQINQIIHMIRRITNRRHGLKEADVLRIVQALIISRITYHAPYHRLTQAETKQLDTLIRTAVKTATGIPTYASTNLLLRLGLHNTTTELIEAQKVSQLERLKRTPTGRHVLKQLGYSTSEFAPRESKPIAPKIRANITVTTIPRNMHPEHHAGRRAARAKALHRIYGSNPDTLYTDAADYPAIKAKVAAVADWRGEAITSATVRTGNSTEAEECAIALAVSTPPSGNPINIISDSQEACRNFAQGRISPTAHHILHRNRHIPPVCLIWTPAHASLPGNERVHAIARGLTLRAPAEDQHNSDKTESIPLTYTHILQHYRLSRRTLPPPHTQLTREEAAAWRQLQTNTFPSLSLRHAFYPTMYPDRCPSCGGHPNLYHSTWECPKPPTQTPIPNPSPSGWEAALSSAALDDQRGLIDRARRIAAANGALD